MGYTFFFFKAHLLLKIFIYLFIAVLVLCCCLGFSLVVVSGDYSLLQCSGFSLWWLLVAEHGLQGAWASVAEASGL